MLLLMNRWWRGGGGRGGAIYNVCTKTSIYCQIKHCNISPGLLKRMLHFTPELLPLILVVTDCDALLLQDVVPK